MTTVGMLCAYYAHDMSNKRKSGPAKGSKRPKNLSLESDDIAKADELAAADGRNFSGEVTWLIRQEHKRRFQKAA